MDIWIVNYLFWASLVTIQYSSTHKTPDKTRQNVAVVVKGRKSVYRKWRKMRKRVSYIKPARKQIIIFTNVIKWMMNYCDTNIYYLTYAGSIIKIKMRKSHAFYHVQLTVLMHARRSYLLVTTFYHGTRHCRAINTDYLRAWIRSGAP